MSTAHHRSTPFQAGDDGLVVPLDGLTIPASESPRGRLERRRMGLRSIGRRTIDRQLAGETRLAQERRRVAAELHDLVMQDVSFALACARAIAADPALAERHADAAVAAGERALTGARSIVESLSRRERVPLLELFEAGIRAAARETPLKLELPECAAEPDQPTTDALLHIGREAVTNAVKHGAPRRVEVELAHADEWQLTVRDDGRGFEPGRTPTGFGLESLRRSAEALGGSCTILSAPGLGTRVEVSLP
jgi:signal transduction histidine kinase